MYVRREAEKTLSTMKKGSEENKYSTIFVDGYPPQEHMIRDLLVSLEFQGKSRSTIRAPVVQEVCTDHGAMQVGVIATLVDILGGALSIRAVYPDWIATADLLIHTIGRATSGAVVAAGSVMRAGSTTVVIEVDILEETGNSASSTTSIGSAMMTYSRLSRTQGIPELEMDEQSIVAFHFGIEGSGLNQSYLDEVGIRVLDKAAGVIEINMSNYIRNSFGSLQGGMVAILGDVAGQHAARTATGKPLITSDLAIHYLSQGKVGPFRTKARVLRTTGDTALTRIEVIDRGADECLIALVTNTLTL